MVVPLCLYCNCAEQYWHNRRSGHCKQYVLDGSSLPVVSEILVRSQTTIDRSSVSVQVTRAGRARADVVALSKTVPVVGVVGPPPVRCNVASRVCLRRPLLVTLRPGCCFPLWFL